MKIKMSSFHGNFEPFRLKKQIRRSACLHPSSTALARVLTTFAKDMAGRVPQDVLFDFAKARGVKKRLNQSLITNPRK